MKNCCILHGHVFVMYYLIMHVLCFTHVDKKESGSDSIVSGSLTLSVILNEPEMKARESIL